MASTPLPRATMLGPYADPHFAGASGHMLAFCQACCPRLEIQVPVNDHPYLVYWMYKGFVPDALVNESHASAVLFKN